MFSTMLPRAVVALVSVAVLFHRSEASELDFSLNTISQTVYPHAKCLDGTPATYYWRPGRGKDAGESLIIFFQGGGWCYPSDIQQPCEPLSNCKANCHIRANTSIGSSKFNAQTVPASALEGGTGFLSGNESRAGEFAGFAVAYANYCDGGSFSGTMTTPDVALNGTGPLYYAGKFNLDATLEELVKTKGVASYKRIVLSGCSAGGMACALHCDYVRDYFARVNKSDEHFE
jgi:O-palmitoleoyl-L-serine hydrolase